MQEKEIGKITHYFGHLSVGIIELTDALTVGEEIHIKGHSSDIAQKVDSIQIEHVTVNEGKKGDAVGIKVSGKVHPGDKVFKIIA